MSYPPFIKKLSKLFYRPIIKPYQIVGILNKFGHAQSIKKELSIDQNGDPIPWFTYPSIHYINQLNLKDKIIFEWGSGYSSSYFCNRAKAVYSVEHNLEWYKQVQKFGLENHHLLFKTDREYVNSIKEQGKKFDIIIVDGVLREECLEIAPQFLQEGGMIILDNSDRHPSEAEKLRKKKFIQVDFHGFGPINKYTWTTSLFLDRSIQIDPIDIQPANPLGAESRSIRSEQKTQSNRYPTGKSFRG